ncbi:MAG: Gfo/Idh/MocA family oxidoreductase [Jaaginema sp. PMC 1079.18]|nr:Gfo/Idh/MocA family oxidoreductase [Jaaginema sp. PMC 1080.18]MEC4850877.1 Gfo/Idh/MocA family oxidoreductase [Jaaginema sp. PMC 1079.18]MEC4868839.1 Gfo/Idh/MocA family oxidoreductase [Jaaginema sp. PMC 1078.18]
MIKLGFIGTGFVAQQCHFPSFDSTEGCKIMAVSDLQSDLANKIRRRYEVPKVYYSHRDLLSDPEIDAVVITVPRPLTSGLCLDALQAGKMVFTEKPVALNSSTGLKLLEVSRSLNLPVQVGYMRRYDSGVLRAAKYLRELRYFEKYPLLVRAYCYMGDSYCSPFGDFKSTKTIHNIISKRESRPSWLDEETSRVYETYLNVFSHILDLLGFLLDTTLSVEKTALDSKGQGIVLLSSTNDIAIDLSTAKCSLNQWMEGISFVFSDQILDLSLNPAFLKNTPSILQIRRGDRDDTVETIRPKWSWAFRNQAANFIEICSRWPDTETNLAAAVEQIVLVESIFAKN